MPEFSTFRNGTGYYSVLAHELTQWSGAKHRLNRDLSNRFTPECLNDETGKIDMRLAVTDVVPRSMIELNRYLPTHGAEETHEDAAEEVDAQSDEEDVEGQESDEDAESSSAVSDSAWLTKILSDDVPVLEAIADNRRLDDLILVGWKKLGKGGAKFGAARPSGSEGLGWKPAKVMGYGVKVGGKLDRNAAGLPVYKAKHLPPDGMIDGDPLGRWNGEASLVDTVRFYAWDGIGEQANTYVIRNIATQPVFAPHLPDVYFTNTVYCYRLAEPFPLNVWSVSRVVAWFMAMTSRTSVVQGFFHTVCQRHTRRMPIPAEWTNGFIDQLDSIGERLFRADREIAAGRASLDEVVEGVGSRKLRNRLDLIEAGVISRPKDVPLPEKDANWEGAKVRQEEDSVAFVTYDEAGEVVPAPTETGGLCEIRVTDAKLRRWIAWLAKGRLESGKLPDQNWIQNLAIPDDLDATLGLLERYEEDAAQRDFDEALNDLDAMVAEALGLSDDQLAHIHEAFESDMLLKSVTPQWRHHAKSGES